MNCPFCGGAADWRQLFIKQLNIGTAAASEIPIGRIYCAACQNCTEASDQTTAVAAWNRRP